MMYTSRGKQLVAGMLVFLVCMVSIVTPSALAQEQGWLADILDKVVQLPQDEAYDVEEAARMKERIGRIDTELLALLYERGGWIELITTNVTGYPIYEYLSGVTPRGWEGTGLTWDDVPGSGGIPVLARIGYSDYGMGHGSINLELHETAHALDHLVFGWISDSEEFKQIQQLEKYSLFGDNAYVDYPEEYFAEAFAYYYLDEGTRAYLLDRAPATYQFFEAIIAEMKNEYYQTLQASIEEQSYSNEEGKDGDLDSEHTGHGIENESGNEEEGKGEVTQGSEATGNQFKVYLNGEQLLFPTEPVVKNGRTLVPMRVIFEALGAEVEWVSTTRQVIATRGELTIVLTIGSSTAILNDNLLLHLDTSPEMINGSTMIPLRFVSEAMGAVVVYEAATKTIRISQ